MKDAPEIVTRAEALRRGWSTYFSGKPCRRGHIAIKRVSGGCADCKPLWKIKPPDAVQRAAKAARERERRKTPAAQAAEKARAERRRNDPEYVARLAKASRKSQLKQYGLTESQYDAMLAAQRGVCAICCGTDPKGRRLVVDHSHATLKVRGLLCVKCNSGIGMFDEDSRSLLHAVEYLKRHE